MAFGEVGRCGVAIDSIDDVDRLFDGIDLEKISVSLTINPSAWVVYSMFVAVAEQRGYDLRKLTGTLQADPLKEYVAQKEWIYPVRPAVRLLRDLIVHSAQATPKMNPISLSGYHLSDVGGNAIQEVAFIMAFTIAYCEEVVAGGMDIDDFAPRLSFFFISHQDFFEQICKFRAARRIYAKIMAERFGAKKAESMRLRVHVQTAAMSLTKVEPHNNLIRTAIQALGDDVWLMDLQAAAEIVAASRLVTFRGEGPGVDRLSEEIGALPAVETAAPFGAALHVSGPDREALVRALAPWRREPFVWRETAPTLEAVFIHLMGRAEDGVP